MFLLMAAARPLAAVAQLPWGQTFYITGYSQKFTKEGQEGRVLTQSLFASPTRNTVTFDHNIITIKLDGFIVDMLKVTDIQENAHETTGLCVSLKYKFEYTYCLFRSGKHHNVDLYNFDLYTPVLLDRYQLTASREAAEAIGQDPAPSAAQEQDGAKGQR